MTFPNIECSGKTKGIIAAILAAITFGFIPIFSKPAIALHYSPACVLTYRFGLSTIILLFYFILRRQSVTLRWNLILPIALMSIFYSCSAGFLIDGYNYMSGGVTGVIHFTYPVWVMIILSIIYHERIRLASIVAIVITLAGMYCLGVLGSDESFLPGANKIIGIAIVLSSGIACAVYYVGVNKTRCREVPALKMTFWLVFFSTATFGIMSATDGTLQLVKEPHIWSDFINLALIATLASNFLLIYAIKHVGSTYSAILGALEPVTAVLLCAIMFHEQLTLPILSGISLILIAVIIIIKSSNTPSQPDK